MNIIDNIKPNIFTLNVEEQQRSPFTNIQKRLFIVEGLKGGSKRVGNTQSNHVIVIRDCTDSEIIVVQNQRIHSIFFQNLTRCKLVLLDSVVVASRSCMILNCQECEFVCEDADVRRMAVYSSSNCIWTYTHSPPVVDNVRFFWFGDCKENIAQVATINPVIHAQNVEYTVRFVFPIPHNTNKLDHFSYFDEIEKLHSGVLLEDGVLTQEGKRIYNALSPYVPENLHFLHTQEEIEFQLMQLEGEPFVIPNKELSVAYDNEREEVEESEDETRAKVRELLKYLTPDAYTVFFTGAGISTSANLPDFRGPQGVWTLRAKGQMAKGKNLTSSYPTYSHYAITELARRHLLKFVVSTNMDCLHLRSGLPKHLISEQHGNCHKERCGDCGSIYYRQYDTLSTVYSTRSHITGRVCTFCGGQLKDTIIHFSESLHEDDLLLAGYHARQSTLSIVMGTSMNVQPAACFPDKCLRNNNGMLVIVNLQKTPYDNLSGIRIYARTDTFSRILMEELGVKDLDQSLDILNTFDKKEGEEEEEEEEDDESLISRVLVPRVIISFTVLIAAICTFYFWV